MSYNNLMLIFLLFLWGCNASTPQETPHLDSAVTADAGVDSGPIDSGNGPVDTGTDTGMDAGVDAVVTNDAAVTVDAGVDSGYDTGTPDAGVQLYVCVMRTGSVVNGRRDCSSTNRVAYFADWTAYPPFDLTLANELRDAMIAGDYSGYASVTVVTTNSPKFVGISTYYVNSTGVGTLVVETVCVYSTATQYAIDNGHCVQVQ